MNEINGEKNNYGAKLWTRAQSEGKKTKLGLASEIYYTEDELKSRNLHFQNF